MEHDEFLTRMENLKKPDPTVSPPQQLKLMILSTRSSATLGVWIIIIPLLFLFFVILKYYFRMNTEFLSDVEIFIGKVDKNPITWFLQPLLLLVLPFASILINLLAITQIHWQPELKILNFSVKLKWLNIIIMLVSTIIVTIFILYLITENLAN
jgi:hypothetical protein